MITFEPDQPLQEDLEPLLAAGLPVWVQADFARYRRKVINFCRQRGWDYSISLTDGRKRGPVLHQLEGLPERAWTDIGLCEEAV